MFSIEMRGCDIVLGVKWLCTVGPINMDFKELHICFQNEGNHYTFTNEFDRNLVQAQQFEFENRNKTSLCSHTREFDRNLVQAQQDCEFDRNLV